MLYLYLKSINYLKHFILYSLINLIKKIKKIAFNNLPQWYFKVVLQLPCDFRLLIIILLILKDFQNMK